MSLVSQLSSFLSNNLQLRLRVTRNRVLPFRVQPCTDTIKAAAKLCSDEVIFRRSASYRPSKWDYQFIESLTSEYVGEPYTTRIEELKSEVKTKLERADNDLHELEMIDTLQRLGVAYHFEDEIERALNSIYINPKNCRTKDLYATALEFRLLRQQGYNINQEVFDSFKDEQGKFKACLCDDIKGLVCLYEASFLSVRSDNILDEAKDFARKNLEIYVNEIKINGCNDSAYLFTLASHALELPLHWRMQRSEAMWFIHVYENNVPYDPIILQFAKLDFNMVQAIHQQDLQHATSWWKKMGLGEKLEFVRARPMEGFLWTVGGVFEPEFGYFRRMLTRVGALVTVIDDIYDVYGTLDELRLFTDVVVRWDINAMEQLPHYMKICFLALYNSINEMAFDLLKDQGFDVIPFLKKGWADLCKSYLVEAEWYQNGYKPSMQEYLQNGWISISAPLLLVHAYFTATNQITDEASQCLKGYPEIVRSSSLITRLADDLATSSHEFTRGDNAKAMECYAHENGGSEAEARDHVRALISEEWKKMNEYAIGNTILSQTFIKMAKNLARTSLCMYQFGDGFGAQNLETRNHVISLIIQPIPLS
ncbi:terpene synthase 10-like [Mercurialis annua]|uniref:terpene synthase 10-like n=1 Tax=Mercurialis annua TaxID=3986 RepID=UPI0021604E02|nr:terpene synthase 10-like [Mercurialis annua]